MHHRPDPQIAKEWEVCDDVFLVMMCIHSPVDIHVSHVCLASSDAYSLSKCQLSLPALLNVTKLLCCSALRQ